MRYDFTYAFNAPYRPFVTGSLVLLVFANTPARAFTWSSPLIIPPRNEAAPVFGFPPAFNSIVI